MKKTCYLMLVLMLVLMVVGTTASAIEVLPMNGTHTSEEGLTEPIVTPDPRAVKVGSDRDELVENDEFEDHGTVWVEWSGRAISLYGCTTAKINYTNPTRSNIGVTLSMAIFDEDLLRYFGTTYRSEEEQLELAMTGLKALKEGITPSSATKLLTITEYFEGMTEKEIDELSPEELVNRLAEHGFLGMTAEELFALDENGLREFTEVERLEVAKIGIYNPEEYYLLIGEDALINPGYAIYEIDLYSLPGRLVLPKGEYDAAFVLNGYMADKNEMSDFFIHLPITLVVQKDLPEELQEEYSLELAVRIDE